MINLTKVRIIEADVLNIIKQFEQGENRPVELPIPIFEIAENLFHVRVDLEKFRSKHKNILGVIIPYKRWIILNKISLGSRLRFTLAHELGHWWIDHIDKYHTSIDFNQIPLADKKAQAREKLANYFASVILMPQPILLSEVKKFESLDTQSLIKLSDVFQVSYQAILIRLEGLQRELQEIGMQLELTEPPEKHMLSKDSSELIKKYTIVKVDYSIIDHSLYRKIKELRKKGTLLYALLSNYNNQDIEVFMELDCFDGFVFIDQAHEQDIIDSLANDPSICFKQIKDGQWVHYLDKPYANFLAEAIGEPIYFTRSDGETLTTQSGLLDLNNLIEAPMAIANRNDAKTYIRNMKAIGKKIVIVTGCFDLITNAHVRFLKRAKARGDILVVGLEDDNRVRAFKGSLRPVNTIAQRAEVMDAFEFVDKVFVIKGSPKLGIKAFYTKLHKELRANILAVSDGDVHLSDRKDEIEAAGGILLIVSRLEKGSTTSLIREFLDETEFSDMVYVSKPKLKNIIESEHGWRQLNLELD